MTDKDMTFIEKYCQVKDVNPQIGLQVNGRYFPNKYNITGIFPKLKVNNYDPECNSLGFRSDEFKTKHEGLHILFAGCSESFGEGGSLEDSWTKRLYNKINKIDKTSGFFNIAVPGISTCDIIAMILEYIKINGKPDFIFINFPTLEREVGLLLSDDIKNYNSTTQTKELKELEELDHLWVRMFPFNFKEKKSFKYIKILNDNPSFLTYHPKLLNIKTFEELCHFANINLIWTTWSNRFHYLITDTKIPFNNYCPLIDFNYQDELIFQIIETDKNYTIRKNDGHYGTAHHEIWSRNIFDKYKELRYNKV